MPSNLNVWDYFKHHSAPLGIKKPQGTYCFYTFDAFIEKILVTKIRRSLKHTDEVFKSIFAGDLTTDWWENEFGQLQLFAHHDSFIIHHCENLTKDCIDFFQQNDFTLGERAVVFIFNKKTDFYENLAAQNPTRSTQLEAPKFWEWDKMFNFLAQEMRVPLSTEVQDYLLQNLVPGCNEFVTALNSLRNIDTRGQALSLTAVRELIVPGRIDQFALAKLFSQKKKKEFFTRLIEINVDYKDWQLFFSFMQGHLLKLAGTELLQNKKRLTQYDHQLIHDAKNWTSLEVDRAAQYFGKLQIMAKKNDSFLREEIRLGYISCLHRSSRLNKPPTTFSAL